MGRKEPGGGLAMAQRHAAGLKDSDRIDGRRHGPGHDPAAEEVQDGGEVDPGLAGGT